MIDPQEAARWRIGAKASNLSLPILDGRGETLARVPLFSPMYGGSARQQEIADLMRASASLANALAALVFSEPTRAWLKENDPQAYAQAWNALVVAIGPNEVAAHMPPPAQEAR